MRLNVTLTRWTAVVLIWAQITLETTRTSLSRVHSAKVRHFETNGKKHPSYFCCENIDTVSRGNILQYFGFSSFLQMALNNVGRALGVSVCCIFCVAASPESSRPIVSSSFSDVHARKPICAFGSRYGDSAGRAASMSWNRSRHWNNPAHKNMFCWSYFWTFKTSSSFFLVMRTSGEWFFKHYVNVSFERSWYVLKGVVANLKRLTRLQIKHFR